MLILPCTKEKCIWQKWLDGLKWEMAGAQTEGFIFVLVGGRVVNDNDYMGKARRGQR